MPIEMGLWDRGIWRQCRPPRVGLGATGAPEAAGDRGYVKVGLRRRGAARRGVSEGGRYGDNRESGSRGYTNHGGPEEAVRRQ